MKWVLSVLVALLTVFAFAAAPQKAVIVSYPSDTPNSVLDEAKDAIIEAGGIITHSYNLIKAFAAKAPESALQSVQAASAKYNVVIEDDQIVTTNGKA